MAVGLEECDRGKEMGRGRETEAASLQPCRLLLGLGTFPELNRTESFV